MPTIQTLTIQLTPTDRDASPLRYSRTAVESVVLTVGHGIEGDLKAGKNPKRQINLMSAEALDSLKAEGFTTEPAGQLGEQMRVSGLDVDGLPVGARLRVGSAVIEIAEPRRGCGKFEQAQGLSPQRAAGRLGQMAFVVESGTVRLGDAVDVLQPAAQPE
ncbi:MAG: MOSC domain-containing protein [Anaerolineae bacterium]|nr:MOSC domain-containing protein [Anaerolineae bacterium]